MSKQLSFTDLEQSTKKKLTRREIFLAEMDKVNRPGFGGGSNS